MKALLIVWAAVVILAAAALAYAATTFQEGAALFLDLVSISLEEE